MSDQIDDYYYRVEVVRHVEETYVAFIRSDHLADLKQVETYARHLLDDDVPVDFKHPKTRRLITVPHVESVTEAEVDDSEEGDIFDLGH